VAGQSSAEKRHKQSEKRNIRNRAAKSQIKTAKKKFTEAVDTKESENAEKSFRFIEKLIDTAARKGILHKNTAARKKSRMQKALNKVNNG
jgi:small subunit ribosomal protein S20